MHKRTNIYGHNYKSAILELFSKTHLTITSHNFAVPLARTAKRLVSFIKRPHTIHIHKITIIIGSWLILGLLAGVLTSPPEVIAQNPQPPFMTAPAPLKALPDSNLQPVSELAVYVAPVVVSTYPSSCSDPKSCIYSHESGNDPTRYNSSGCLGLGQACPASKLLAVCPTMDYTCEDNWFTGYMESKYGTWANAWAFWQQNFWW